MKTYLKPFLVGACGSLLIILIAGICFSLYVLWTRAFNGEQAFEYILRVNAAQQGAPSPGRPSPAPSQPPKP